MAPTDQASIVQMPLGKISYWQIFTKEQLTPFPNAPKLTLLSADRALVSLSGSFLSSESEVLVGDTTIDRANGLAFSNETGLSFVIPLKDLGRASDLYLVNRFLEPTPIRRNFEADKHPLKLLSQNCSENRTPGPGGCCSAVQLAGTDRYRVIADLASDMLPNLADLIAVAGDTVVTGADIGHNNGLVIQLLSTNPITSLTRLTVNQPPTATKISTKSVEFDLPAEAIRKNPELTIREVFGGPERAVRCRLPVLPFVEKVSVVSRDKNSATLALQGRGLQEVDAVFVGSDWVSLESLSDTIAVFQVGWERLAGVESLLIRSGKRVQQIVALKEKPEMKKPIISTKPEVLEGYSGAIDLEGENLESIRRILFEGLELKKEVDGKKLKIILVTQVTAKAAPRALTLELLDGSEVLLPVIVKPVPAG